MIAPPARRDIARAYARGQLVKVIAHDFGVSEKAVAYIARSEGVPGRLSGRPVAPRHVDDASVLALFNCGMDTVSIAARLKIKHCEAANALARARDAERER